MDRKYFLTLEAPYIEPGPKVLTAPTTWDFLSDAMCSLMSKHLGN